MPCTTPRVLSRSPSITGNREKPVRPGVGVVVSPLIALMQDQVDALSALGVRAGFINSMQNPDERR
ncbi:hypothetical protein, partial [Nocardia cyriacigeorgica]|uniref:hypothetical protein n=1 Tax=Nocardia cyriacigeorgica TaxID=135487 RepID=UPI003CC7E5A8